MIGKARTCNSGQTQDGKPWSGQVSKHDPAILFDPRVQFPRAVAKRCGPDSYDQLVTDPAPLEHATQCQGLGQAAAGEGQALRAAFNVAGQGCTRFAVPRQAVLRKAKSSRPAPDGDHADRDLRKQQFGDCLAGSGAALPPFKQVRQIPPRLTAQGTHRVRGR